MSDFSVTARWYSVNTLSFFFTDTATPEIYTLSLHDALPIYCGSSRISNASRRPGTYRDAPAGGICGRASRRSEEHTSELQSRGHLVCRLLLEKKKKHKNLRSIK